MPQRFFISVLFLLLSAVAMAAENPLLQPARERLARGDGAGAYRMLLRLEGQLAGEPDYDLLLAQAALKSGQANIALFVLERVVFAHPQLSQGRLLMAEAYIRMGDYSQAGEILRGLLREPGLAAADRRQAVQMLGQIRAHTRHSQLSAYLGLAVGHDSNANAATASNSFMGINLTANSIATPSTTQNLNAGVHAAYRLANQDQLFSAVDWARNSYPQADFVDNDLLGLQLGWKIADRYVLGLQSQTVDLNGAFNNRGNNIYGVMQTDSAWQWQPFFRFGRVNYDSANSIKDVTQTIIGTQFSLSHWIRGAGMSILLAEDSPVEARSPYGRRYIGWQIHHESRYLKRLSLNVSAGAVYSEYENGPFIFGLQRNDRVASLGMGLNYRTARLWDFGVSVAYTNSWSTVALYQYERLTYGLNIRRNFVR